MGRLRYHDVVFDDGFLTAVRADGTILRFTRRERTLLAALSVRPRRLFTRTHLYDVLGSDGSDRAVDHAVNKLRAKLGDSGRDQRFISTQYGEGYVWVAPLVEDDVADGAFIAIQGGPSADMELLEQLRAELQTRAAPTRRVVVDLETPAPGGAAARFAVLVVCDGPEAAVVLRDEASRQVLQTLRRTFGVPASQAVLATLAEALTDTIWARLALGRGAPATPGEAPLDLRLQEATTILGGDGRDWAAHEAPIAAARLANPDDPTLTIAAAFQLFAPIILKLTDEPLTAEYLAPLAEEAERLVLSVLPQARRDPILAIGAANALFYADRGGVDLAEELAREAFAKSAAFAAAYQIMARLHARRGELDEAIALYDRALQLAEPGTEFEVYLLYLKATTLMAADDRAGVALTFDRINVIRPSTRRDFGCIFIPPAGGEVPADLARLAGRVDLDRARRLLAYQHFMIARYFRGAGHAANIMRGPLSHFLPRFGPAVLPPALAGL